MNTRNKVCTSLFIFLFIYLVAGTSRADKDSFEQSKKYLDDGISTYDEKLLHDARKMLVQLVKETPDDYIYVHYVALTYLGLCDLKNLDIAKSSVKKLKKELKAERVVLAEEGIPYADKSIALKNDFSESHRVKGALISNRISGMISGMRYGSMAEEEIDVALQIDNKNAMAHVEKARMFINKPELLGGDINKGMEILNNVIMDNPGMEKAYVNLGVAYEKNGEYERAINTFKEVLGINSYNLEARFYLDQLMFSR